MTTKILRLMRRHETAVLLFVGVCAMLGVAMVSYSGVVDSLLLLGGGLAFCLAGAAMVVLLDHAHRSVLDESDVEELARRLAEVDDYEEDYVSRWEPTLFERRLLEVLERIEAHLGGIKERL